MSRSHELGVFVENWPEESAEHWSFDQCRTPLLTGISQLLEAQKHVNARLALEDPGEGLSGAGLRSLMPIREVTVKTDDPDSPSKVKSEKPILAKTGIPASSIDGEPLLRKRASLSPRKAGPKSSKGAQPKPGRKGKKGTPGQDAQFAQQESVASHSGSAPLSPAQAPVPATLPDNSVYAQTKIVGTTSAKLSYLLSQILKHCEDEKILVFYSGDNAAYYISQALELFHIKHEIYAKSLAANLKAEYVVKFQEQEDLRVLLMDVGQAAFGLNICAASRVYFVNPVCRPNVEAQAIKRAHRIGQTRKVTVETLVLKDSIEEKMLERSQSMTTAEHLDAKVFEEESSIREIIQSARVLPLAQEEDKPGLSQMALIPAQQLWSRPHCLESLTPAPSFRKRKRNGDEDGEGAKGKSAKKATTFHRQDQIAGSIFPGQTSTTEPLISSTYDSDDESLSQRRARAMRTHVLVGSKDPFLPVVMGQETLSAVSRNAYGSASSSSRIMPSNHSPKALPMTRFPNG